MTVTALDPTTALVLIDLQFSIVAMPTAHNAAEIVNKGVELATTFRDHGLPVILATYAMSDTNLAAHENSIANVFPISVNRALARKSCLSWQLALAKPLRLSVHFGASPRRRMPVIYAQASLEETSSWPVPQQPDQRAFAQHPPSTGWPPTPPGE